MIGQGFRKLKLSERPLHAEASALASPDRDLCKKCGLFADCRTPFMLVSVPKGWEKGRRVLVVAEAPGQHEDEESEKPLTGPAGQLFDDLAATAGLKPRDVAKANACRCRPHKNATPSLVQIRACRPFLLDVLIRLKPRVVIALGGTAIRALGNLSRKVKVGKMRGHAIDVPGLPDDVRPLAVYATYHPSAVLRGRKDFAPKIVDDLARSVRDLRPTPGNHVPVPPTRWLGVDTEYAPNGALLTLGTANGTSAVALEAEDGPENLVPVIRAATGLCGHSLPGDLDYLVKLGSARPEWLRGEKTRDTMLLARLVDENRGKGRYNLESLAFEYADVLFWKAPTEAVVKAGQVETLSPELRRERCRRDAHAARVLADALIWRVREEYGKNADKLITFSHRVDMALRRVYLAGAVVDMQTFETQGAALRQTVDRLGDLLERHAHKAGMVEFSGTNDHHVRELLYERLGYSTDRETAKSGLPAVDKYTLKSLNTPVVETLLEYRRARKLLGVWYGTPDRTSKREPLAKLIEPAGRVGDDVIGRLRFRLRTLATRTGRRASGADVDTPDAVGHNAQNWPKSVRQIIRSRWPGGKIGAFDYRKLEPRIIAWVSGDEWLMETFTTGEGYIGIGRELFGKRVEEGTQEYTIMKSTVLAAHYNAIAETLAERLAYQQGVRFAKRWALHVSRCQELLDAYFKKARRLKPYMAAREEELLTTGRVVCPSGAIRHLPCPDGRKTVGYKHLLNEAINAPIQNTAAYVTGAALVDVEAALCREYGGTVSELHIALVHGQSVALPLIINEVHDELTIDLPPLKLNRHIELIVETMRTVPTLHALMPCNDLPLDVDPKIASRWHGDDQ